MNASNGKLPCGTDLGPLVDQVAEGRTAANPGHQRSCPHCREALDELEALWRDVRELATDDVEVPGALLAKVMERVRRDQAQASSPSLPLDRVAPRLVRHALLRGGRGTTKIADSVIAELIRRSALATGGVRSLRGDTVAVEGNLVSARLGLVVEFGLIIPELVELVRARVTREAEAMTGLRLETLVIDVVDVVED